jgi:hypothetical protein
MIHVEKNKKINGEMSYQSDRAHDRDGEAHAEGATGGLLPAGHVGVVVWHLHREAGSVTAAARTYLKIPFL